MKSQAQSSPRHFPLAAGRSWLQFVLAAVACAVVWRLTHALLFREWLDRPVLFAGWLIGGLSAAVILTRLVRRRREEPARTAAWSRRLSLFVVVALLLAAFHYQYLGVMSDGRDYFVQARSIVIDGDLDISQAEIDAIGAPGQAVHYPVGSALLWAPFLAATHAYLLTLSSLGMAGYPPVGYGGPYEVAVGLATLFYGILGLTLIARALEPLFGAGLAAVATIATASGSFVLWYLVAEASMSHGASLFATSLFLFVWLRTRETRSPRQWVALGAAAGLMTIVRWQNALFALVLVPEAITAAWRIWRSPGDRRRLAGMYLRASGAGIAMLLPQFWLWHRNSDGWLAVPADRFAVNWFEPMMANPLFSPLHGLTTWSPILYLSLVGLVPFVWRLPRIGMLLSLALVGQVYANSMIEVWWGGSSFGGRRFAACSLIFAAGLAALIDWARRHPVPAASCALAPLILINVLLVGEVRSGRLSLGHGLTAGDLVRPVYAVIGNPLSFPANLAFALEHGVPLSAYDRIGTQVYQRLYIDVGTTGDAPFLTYGWSAAEGSPGATYRWAVGDAAGVAMPISRRAPYSLRIVVEPFAPAGADGPRLTLRVNGRRVDEIALEPAVTAYQLDVPEDALRPNLNHFRFEFSAASSPSKHGLSGDERRLAVAFHEIEIARR